MISEGKILEIRERSSIVEVISDHLALKRVGRNYLGLCPFHAEKTPSFTVNEEKGIFHCFGCGAGGDVFHFLAQHDHLTFPEAAARLASRYGIALEPRDRPDADRAGKEPLYRINERVAAYFHEALLGRPEGKRALDYIRLRGIDERAARQFLLGYASPNAQGLVGFLKKEGLPLNGAIRLGLLSEKAPQRYSEKFSDRLIFPIVNPAGKVVGFGGRVIGQGLPKYLNSPDSPLFHKGANLYGLFQAKEAIRELDRVVVVEGYLDVLALAQFGISYAVATLGTALTPDHVRVLGRYTKNIIALFDGDDAGRKAAARSFEIFIEVGLFGKAAFLPADEDPDTFVRSKGKEPLEGLLEQAIPLADYYFTWLEGRHGKSLTGKSEIAREIRRLLAKVRDPLEVDLLVRRAVDLLGIREEILRLPDRQAAGESRASSARTGLISQEVAREDFAERSLLSLMLCFPSVTRYVEQEKDLASLFTAKRREIVDKILFEWRREGKVEAGRLLQDLPSDQASDLSGLLLDGQNVKDEDCERMAADCLAHLRRKHLKDLARDLRQAIRLAEERNDEKAKRERMLEWQEVVRKERQLEQRFDSKTGIR